MRDCLKMLSFSLYGFSDQLCTNLSKSPICPNLSAASVTFPKDNVIGAFPLRPDSFPQSAIVFTFMCAPQYFWTLGSFVYLECSNIQITGQENIYILFILQFLKCCSLEPPSRKALYAWPPETQPSFLSKNPDL